MRHSLPPLLSFLLMTSTACALDYVIVPTPPNLVKDAATSFLTDLSTPKTQPDFATVPGAAFRAEGFKDGCYRAPITLPTALLAGGSWTMEIILRVPPDVAAAKQDIDLGGFEAKDNCRLRFGLSPGVGAGFNLFGWAAQGRRHPFQFAATAGGNGYTLHRDAAGEWVYVTFAIDLAARRGGAVARDLKGNVLKRQMSFCNPAALNEEFLKPLPETQRAAALDQCWREMAATWTRGLPPAFTLGSDRIELRAVRISNRFRPELVYPRPAFAGIEGAPKTAAEIDPARAVKHTPSRSVGYNDYNQRAVPVEESYIPLAPGQKIVMPVKGLGIGLYSFWLYGSIDPKGRKEIGRVWQPAPMEFEATDAQGKIVGRGRLLLKQSFSPRFMTAFSFHVDEPGDFTATFTLAQRAMESARIQQINFLDILKELPDEAVKKEQRLQEGKSTQLTALTDARRQRDAAIWNSCPPLNIAVCAAEPPAWRTLPKGVAIPDWNFKAWVGQTYPGMDATFQPLDIIDPATKKVLPHDRVLAGDPLDGAFPDDGTGIFLPKAEYPELAQDMYWFPRARLMCRRFERLEAIVVEHNGLGMARKYLEGGDPNIGHDVAMVLARLAYDWPALEYAVQDPRLCSHDPDLEFNQHWSYGRGGKVINWSWSAGDAQRLIEAYDFVFPYIKDNALLAEEIHRFVPWVKTPQDVVKLIDRQLVFASVRDAHRGFLKWNIDDIAGEVLGPGPLTAGLFDLTTQDAELHPFRGTYREGYGTGISRSGVYYTASFLAYALGSAREQVGKAYSMLLLKRAGVQPKLDLSDIERYPKIRGASDFLLDMWVAGGFPFMVGDASGGPHTGPAAWQRLDRATEQKAFAVTGDPRHAWVLKFRHGSQDPAVLKAAEGQRDPITLAPSHVVPDYGAILELNPDSSDLTKKTGATLRLGIGQGHAHHDFLDLNLYAMGLPMAVDLACRNEGTQTWSRPGASWSFLHNHAIAHDMGEKGDPPVVLGAANPAAAGGQEGEPWLRSFNPPLASGSYVNAKGDIRLDRDVLFMEVGDTGTYYCFDLQRLKGGKLHTWCFHGCESDDLQLNVPMENKTVRWIDRTLEGTHKTGTANDAVQAVWTMTRQGREIKHSFMNGGVIKTAACEPAVLGSLYDAKLPPARIRATLLGHAGEMVMQGNPYSQNYAYCFPFLWVQGPAKPESVYPALYEWYRGDQPVIAKAELLSRDPVKVRVTTATGQTDEFTATAEGISAVSRDAKGLRWAKFNGLAQADLPELSFKTTAGYRATIIEIDYARRTLKTSAPLPEDPAVSLGNDGRRTWLALKGKGTEFRWADDLLIAQGEVAEVKVTAPDAAEIKTAHPVLFGERGNRKAEAMVVATEDGAWQFRAGKVIRKPDGAALSPAVFTDANGDGFTDAKTYEIGLGDTILLPSDVTVRRAEKGFAVLTNARLDGRIGPAAVACEPSRQWQSVGH